MMRLFIFDLDGTIVQIERLKAESYAMASADLCPYSVAEADAERGPRSRFLAEVHAATTSSAAVSARFHNFGRF
ncbi:MAG: hypothetical protein KGZ89_07855 [Actinobacteria bacterium]|nr:hypothetical protein [Actinomycetota bacterium]